LSWQLCDPDSYKPSEDDEIGFHALYKPLPLWETQVLAMVSCEDEMAGAVMELAEAVSGRDGWMDDSVVDGLGMARYAPSSKPKESR
jgi:hypothetical protein